MTTLTGRGPRFDPRILARILFLLLAVAVCSGGLFAVAFILGGELAGTP